jgi:hypothetical protein
LQQRLVKTGGRLKEGPLCRDDERRKRNADSKRRKDLLAEWCTPCGQHIYDVRGGGQPISGAGGPIPEPVKDGLRDLPTNAFFAYGYYEGIPRALRAQSSEPAPCQMHAQLFQQLPLTGDAVQIAQQQNA